MVDQFWQSNDKVFFWKELIRKILEYTYVFYIFLILEYRPNKDDQEENDGDEYNHKYCNIILNIHSFILSLPWSFIIEFIYSNESKNQNFIK